MFEVLARAEQALPDLLGSLQGWNSLDVNYEPPRVERLWRTFEDRRLYLHRIHPCEQALYHPHPWPSIIKIVAGGYTMGVGFGEGDKETPLAATLKLVPGAVYEMTHIDGWHYVLPRVPNLSVMLTGAPWSRWSPGPGPDVKLGPLALEEAQRLLEDFQAVYMDYSKASPASFRRSVRAARHIDALRRVGLPAKADLIQFDGGQCRLCWLSVSSDHRCWTESVDGQVVWLPDI